MIIDLRYRPECPVGDGGSMGGFWQVEEVLLNFRSEAEEVHDLGDTARGKSFSGSDLEAGGDFAGVEEALPFLGLLHEFFDPGLSGRLGWRFLGPVRRDGAYYLFGGHPGAPCAHRLLHQIRLHLH